MHQERKRDHLRICLEEQVGGIVGNGLNRYRLVHCALPEMALADVDLGTRFLGHELQAPILISSMTGGTERAARINRNLARAAQALGLAMGLGSQRAGLEDESLMASYQVREVAPDVPLFANLGAVQLNYGYTIAHCQKAVGAVDADGLILHLNPLQEALQAQGTTDFHGLLHKIAILCQALDCPIIVKEVGWGLSASVAGALCGAGVLALDVAGAGGTSWSRVESLRADSSPQARIASAFDTWGIPTTDSLLAARRACPELPIIASGGLATGVEIAKCLALGADLTGLGGCLLAAADDSAQAVQETLEIVLEQLRLALFCCGARRLNDLDCTTIVERQG